MEKDVRWIQRFENYRKALRRMLELINLIEALGDSDSINVDLFRELLVHRFEFTQELAWKVMKDYAEYQGYSDIMGSRDAIRKALSMGLVSDSEWMSTISDRNRSSHNYDDEILDELSQRILDVYSPLFVDFERVMNKKKEEA